MEMTHTVCDVRTSKAVQQTTASASNDVILIALVAVRAALQHLLLAPPTYPPNDRYFQPLLVFFLRSFLLPSSSGKIRFTLSDLPDNPWSQVSPVLPPDTCLHYSRTGFSIPTFLPYTLVILHRISPTHALAPVGLSICNEESLLRDSKLRQYDLDLNRYAILRAEGRQVVQRHRIAEMLRGWTSYLY